MNHSLLINGIVDRSRTAQKVFQKFTQEQIDRIVKEIACTVYKNAELLAKMAVQETKMGDFEDKVQKNRSKALLIWNDLKSRKSVGIIDENTDEGIIYVAKPVGVVCAVTPSTNPIVTPMSNAMFALKGRNSIIIAPHPSAKCSSAKAVELFYNAILRLGAPENIIQIIERPNLELTNELMRQSDVVVATGGMGMVKSAYSSGKPSYGVGAGNVQVIFDRDIDFEKAVQCVIAGRSFDNGIICAGDQSVICHTADFEKVVNIFENNECAFVSNDEEGNKIREAIFIGEDKSLNREIVGKPADYIAQMSGLRDRRGKKILLIKDSGKGDVLRREKMCPVLVICTYNSFQEAIEIAQTNLDIEGKGHTCVIHSEDMSNIKLAAEHINVSRIVVNQPGTAAGGSFYNGFNPTNTLGCGSWGNNSISENLTYKHLINIQQIGLKLEKSKVENQEGIWK